MKIFRREFIIRDFGENKWDETGRGGARRSVAWRGKREGRRGLMIEEGDLRREENKWRGEKGEEKRRQQRTEDKGRRGEQRRGEENRKDLIF